MAMGSSKGKDKEGADMTGGEGVSVAKRGLFSGFLKKFLPNAKVTSVEPSLQSNGDAPDTDTNAHQKFPLQQITGTVSSTLMASGLFGSWAVPVLQQEPYEPTTPPPANIPTETVDVPPMAHRPNVDTGGNGGTLPVTKRSNADHLEAKMRQGNNGGGSGNSGEFLTASIDLFRRERSGHMPSFAYASPQFDGDLVRGTELWPKMARSPGYYLYWDEIKLAEDCSEQIVNLLPAHLKTFSVIELGPGEVDIVQKKTHNLLRAFQKVRGAHCLKDYIAMDVDEGYAKRNARDTGKTFGVREDYIVSDFRKSGLRVQTEATPVMVVFGGTLFNMPKLKDAKPHHILQTYLEYLKDIIGKDGYLIITQDVNTDEKSLLAAYDDPNGYGRETALGIMHRINRDLKTKNFSGHDFECLVRWDQADSRVSINARAKSTKYFEIGDIPFTMQKGQEWSLVNAFKMSAESFKRNAEFAGFEYIGVVPEKTNKRIVAHVLKVA